MKTKSKVKQQAETEESISPNDGDGLTVTKKGRGRKVQANSSELKNGLAVTNEVDPQNADPVTKKSRNTRTRKTVNEAANSVPEINGGSRKRKAAIHSLLVDGHSKRTTSKIAGEENGILDRTPAQKKKKSSSVAVAVSAKEPISNDINGKATTVINIERPLPLGRKLVGGHTSISGGLENSIKDAVNMGGTAFAMFVRNQRTWNCKPMEEAAAEKFRAALVEHEFSPYSVLPHGSYLLNCGAPNEETLEKSRAGLIDELQRCEQLGLTLYNFHPGSTCGKISVDECLDKIGESINLAHAKTKYITVVIENMSRQGYTIGGDFQELRGIIDRVHDKSRIGVCIDTCHAFAAGYDLANEKGYNVMMEDFEKYIGFEYLKGLHLNDSKGMVGCHKDRHENIGKGYIGLDGFRRIMNEPRFNDMPMILETPWVSDDIYKEEVKLLKSLIKT